ncbi:PilW family protein [Ramlibacter sp. XY19]|uniref:PilW family protein n=1 Tax=Ramlibacter paludis TaxID=2908000 RepID=UPI0023D994FD|nr:PilW family protein [Ramlibacter paludis]MCG2592857.1 PilW family protein [Ramlibacter paludis]
MTLRTRIREAGFTLVELMISLALGLLIVLALVTMLINVNRGNNELGFSQRMIENGRFAMQLLETDIQHTGYWAGFVPNYDELTYVGAPALASAAGGQVPTALPNPCLAYSVANWNSEYKANLIGIAAQGGNVTAASTPPYCSGVLTSPKASNDVLVVRHAEPCVAGSGTAECANTLGSANPDVYFQTTQCSTDTTGYVMSTATADFTLHKRNCTALAEIRRVASTLYYVKDVNGTPTLMRSQLAASGAAPTHLAAQPLVEYVEGFRVEFGIDAKSDTNEDVVPTAAVNWSNAAVKTSPRNRGDGIPEGNFLRCTQVTPCTAAQMMNAVAVKVYVLVRAESTSPGYTDVKTYKMGSADTNCTSAANADASAACAPLLGPFNDGYRRHLFTQTFRLVNVAGRRETP